LNYFVSATPSHIATLFQKFYNPLTNAYVLSNENNFQMAGITGHHHLAPPPSHGHVAGKDGTEDHNVDEILPLPPRDGNYGGSFARPVETTDGDGSLNTNGRHAVEVVPLSFQRNPPYPLSENGVASLIINKMIGSGIFTAPPLVLLYTQNKILAFFLWLVGFAYTLIRYECLLSSIWRLKKLISLAVWRCTSSMHDYFHIMEGSSSM
jgi:hypothetical protein